MIKDVLQNPSSAPDPFQNRSEPSLSAEEVMTIVRQHRMEKSIVEPIERVIEPVQKRRSSGLREHLQEILRK